MVINCFLTKVVKLHINLLVQTSWLIYVPAGNKVEKLCDLCNITVNKHAVFGDSSALAPGGVRIGENTSMNSNLQLVI